MPSWLLELAWTGAQLERRLLLEESQGRITKLDPLGDRPLPSDTAVVSGLTIPGLANVHSHAFHRALRGRTESLGGPDSFWTWRDEMYKLAGRLEPDSYHRLALAVYGEMALAGITQVGEFHYLHHRQGGASYSGPAMEEALVAAAEEAGLRLTLLDTCYLRPGFDGAALEGPSTRFSDGNALSWARRVDAFPERPNVRLGAAIHSVRALDQKAMKVVSDWARDRQAPLHLHLSEQLAENQACQAATGLSPTELAEKVGVLGPRSTAVHAIHLSPDDIGRLGSSHTSICVCPTTERDLGDGVCRAAELAEAGSPLCLGTDGHSVVDLFEEARGVELDQRLVTNRRGLHSAEALLRAATAGGSAALGWDAGELRVGAAADFVGLELESTRLAGPSELDLVARVVYSAAPSDVQTVVVGGRPIVENGRHFRLGGVGSLLAQALQSLEVLA